MLEKQNEVKATGEIGEVYTTKTGMNIADPYEHYIGWWQRDSDTRVPVESHDIATHLPWRVWDKCGIEKSSPAK